MFRKSKSRARNIVTPRWLASGSCRCSARGPLTRASVCACPQVRFPRALSAACRCLLAGLLTKEPTKRLGAGPDDALEIMHHPFFASINWADLVAKKVTTVEG